MKKELKGLLVAAAALAAPPALADSAFKWVDDSGVTNYGQRAPNTVPHQVVELGGVQIFEAVHANSAADAGLDNPAARPHVASDDANPAGRTASKSAQSSEGAGMGDLSEEDWAQDQLDMSFRDGAGEADENLSESASTTEWRETLAQQMDAVAGDFGSRQVLHRDAKGGLEPLTDLFATSSATAGEHVKINVVIPTPTAVFTSTWTLPVSASRLTTIQGPVVDENGNVALARVAMNGNLEVVGTGELTHANSGHLNRLRLCSSVAGASQTGACARQESI